MEKKLLPFLIAFSALSVSASAAFYSVFGLSHLFAGASTEVIIMAGAYVSLGIFFSSLTNNQIIAFILSILVSFLFTISGFPLMINFITGILPIEIVELISSFSFLTHFSSIQTGFFSIKGLFFFLSFIALWNYLTIIKFLNRD